MTILLYDHLELEERASRHLKAWKAWHIVFYSLAAVFGLVNFVFIQNTMYLVDDHCILSPRLLEFRSVALPQPLNPNDGEITEKSAHDVKNMTENAQDLDAVPVTELASDDADKTKRDTTENDGVVKTETTTVDGNVTALNENGSTTDRLFLDTSRTLFQEDNDCQFAEFMPIMSTIFAAVWMTLFTMCPGGGHARTGLQQPWSILAPALVFTLVMVALTGYSFTTTNAGLHAFCAAFYDVTNTTTCSAVDAYIERGWNSTWGMSGRIAATRAASAAVWAAWACAAALLLARCLAAPDFVVKRTGVFLIKDPQQKIIPHLKKSKSARSQRSTNSSPTKRDTVSMRSEPTVTTELVSATVEQGPDSAPSSLMATPVRMPRNSDAIRMTYLPNEQFDYR